MTRVNSFFNLWQPELLKNATRKPDMLEWLVAHAPSKQWVEAAAGAVLQVPEDELRALDEEGEWENDSDKEMS